MMAWELITTQNLTHDLLAALFENRIGAIQIPNFVSVENSQLAIQRIYAHGIEYYENVYPRIGKIGITQFEHRYSPIKKQEYFIKALIAHATRKDFFKDSGDPLIKVLDVVQNAWGTSTDIAVEEDSGERYFAGLVRVINKALLHLDWAPFDAPEWTIGKISAQIAWNIYLQTGVEGGETIVYRRLWQPSDELHLLPNSYGYDHSLVEGCDFIRIHPMQGALVFFNSRNFHKVEMTEGETERISFSSFIGLMKPSQELVFWS
jgi:hypothetical protein